MFNFGVCTNARLGRERPPFKVIHLFCIAESRSNLAQQVFFKSGGLVSAFPKTPCVAGQANFPPNVCINKYFSDRFPPAPDDNNNSSGSSSNGYLCYGRSSAPCKKFKVCPRGGGPYSWRAALANAQNLILISSS